MVSKTRIQQIGHRETINSASSLKMLLVFLSGRVNLPSGYLWIRPPMKYYSRALGLRMSAYASI